MLTRTLEPEVMDGDDEAAEYAAMDFSVQNTRFAEDALALIASVPAPLVLDIGTGSADIPLLMLDRHPLLRVVAVDLADSMLTIARQRANERGHAARIDLRKLDAKRLELERGTFDLVMSNSVVHHIPHPVELFRQVSLAVRPKGAIIVRDLARPPSRDALAALVEMYAGGDTKKQRQLFFDSLAAALTIEEVREATLSADLRNLRIEMVSDRHWTAERAACA